MGWAVLLLYSMAAQADIQRLPNCTIWIHTLSPEGKIQEKVLYTRSDTKVACRRLASLHVPIYSRSGEVRKKKVRFRYAEVPWGRQNFPAIEF